MSLHLQPDWQRTVGLYVEVRRNGITIRRGTVNAVMSDNSILWIAADGLDHRVMVEKADGSEIFAYYEWDRIS